MTQNRLISPNSGADQAKGRSRCLLRHGYLGLRFVRYQCYPWFLLTVALIKLLFATGVERTDV